MSSNDILGITMAGLEAGFKVLHIAASPLKTCEADSDVAGVLKDSELRDFDQIPAREGAHIVGVLERTPAVSGGAVRNHMRRLDDSILVSAEEPLPKFLPTLEASPYRLMVKGPEIQGIVTLSDVPKLPVRLMAFTLVTHLEMVMADVIRRECGSDEACLGLLHPKQQKTVQSRLKRRKKQNLHLSLLDLTDLSHKITAVGKLRGLTGFDTALEVVVELRNSLDHASDFVEACGGVRAFLQRLSVVEHWIDALSTGYQRLEVQN